MQAIPGQLQARKLPLSPAVEGVVSRPHARRAPALPLANATQGMCCSCHMCGWLQRRLVGCDLGETLLLLLEVHRSRTVIGEV